MAASSRWKKHPEGSTWGDFGDNDQLGRLNLLTPEKLRQGVAEVREGISFCLSLPLDYPGGNIVNPRQFPPALRPTLRDGKPYMNYVLAHDEADAADVINDDASVELGDMVCLHTGIAQMILDMKGKPDKHILDNSCTALDGSDKKLLKWVTDTGLSALIADNYAVESMPSTPCVGRCASLPLHEHCLFKRSTSPDVTGSGRQ